MTEFHKRILIIFLLLISGIIPAAFNCRPLFAGEKKDAGDFPDDISGTMQYVFSGHDNSGCWNVPKCEDLEWTVDCNLQFKLAKINGDEAQYKAAGGSWQANGQGHGMLTEDFGDAQYTVTVTANFSGSGSFAPNGKNDATLTYHRSDRTFFVTFLIGSGSKEEDIKYTGMGKNSHNTNSYIFKGDSAGKAALSDKQLTFNLDKSRKWTNPNFESKYAGSASGNLTGSGLKADFAYAPQTRGEVTLDGSKSTGNIKKYTWSFEADGELPEGVHFDGDVQLEGKNVRVILLAPVKATLKVEDDKGKSDEKNLSVSIQPRKFQTESKEPTRGKRMDVKPLLVTTSRSGGSLKHLVMGRNVCADCYKSDSSYDPHYLHPQGKRGESGITWEGDGYTIGEVTEGPFKGTYYIKDYSVKMNRMLVVNEHLWADDPGGRHCHPDNPDAVSFMSYNKSPGKKSQWEDFINSIWAHESIHADLEKKSLQDSDPAKEIEAKFGTDHDELSSKVNLLISDLDTRCGDLDKETTVLERLIKIYGDNHFFQVGLLTLIFEGNQVAEVKYAVDYVDIYGFDPNP